MIFVDNFFKEAEPNEVLFEMTNDFTSVQMLANSFYYHIKGSDESCATDKQRMKYKKLALKANEPIGFLLGIKMMQAQTAIKKLELLEPTH